MIGTDGRLGDSHPMDWLTDLPLVPRVLIATSATYFFVIVLMRISGKRTVARMKQLRLDPERRHGQPCRQRHSQSEATFNASLLGMATMVALAMAADEADLPLSRSFPRWIKEEPALVVSNGVHG